ncbi:MAG: MATE family efflux transporter, partial [Candidatus Paceibacterales bacterium]
LVMATIMVTIFVIIICWKAHYFISFFDPKGKFVDFAAPLLSVISTLVIFDLIQVTLAGALRGAGDVKTVMYGRFFVIMFFYIPLAYFFSHLPIENVSLKFCLIYSSFYLSNAVMGFIFLKRVIGNNWQKKQVG